MLNFVSPEMIKAMYRTLNRETKKYAKSEATLNRETKKYAKSVPLV